MTQHHIIALAADTILYAPLYIANEAGLFGDLSVSFGVLKSTQGHDQTGQRGAAPAEAGRSIETLNQTLHAIWRAFDDHRTRPLLTVCDPMHAVLHNVTRGSSERPIIIGTLLERPACWVFNEVHSLQDFLLKLKSGKYQKLSTYAPGMTPDTLTRWLLKTKAAIQPEHFDTWIEHVDDELHAFHPDPQEPTALRAAITVNLLRMHALHSESNGTFRQVLNFSTLPELKNYLMTAILARESTLTNRSPELPAIKSILGGVSFALDMLRADSAQAYGWLHHHYRRRRALSDDVQLLSCDYLEPLAPLGSDSVKYLERTFRELSRLAAYPTSVAITDVRERLKATWQVYREAQQDILPQVKATLSDMADHDVINAIETETPTLTRREQPRMLKQICLAYGRRLVGDLQHPFTSRIVNWIKDHLSGIKMHDLEVVGTFLCFHDTLRMDLRKIVEEFPAKSAERVRSREPYTLIAFGDSGSGKGAFVGEMLSHLREKGLLILYDDLTFDLSKPPYNDMGHFTTVIEEKFLISG